MRLHITYEFSFLFLHLKVGYIKDPRPEKITKNCATYLLFELLELSAFLPLYVLICFQGTSFDFDNQDNILKYIPSCAFSFLLQDERFGIALLRTGGERH
jgi:hypothetical protein